MAAGPMKMDLRIMPRLESNAAFKIAVCLWCHADIRRSNGYELKIIHEIMGNLETLPLSHLLKRRIMNYIGPLRDYLYNWLSKKINDKKMPFREINIGKFLCWTWTNTIDDRRTAKKILSSGILDIATAFRLACITCLENDIAKLWSQVHPSFFSCVRIDLLMKDLEGQEEVLFWIYYFSNKMKKWVPCLTKESSTPKAFNYGFQCGISNANREFGLYFARKCNLSKDMDLVIECAQFIVENEPTAADPELLLIVISHLDDDTIIELFQENPRNVLYIFQCWPLTPFFLDAAEYVYRYLDGEDFFAIVGQLASSLHKYVNNNMLEHIFTEFWNRSPDALRNFVISEWIYDRYLNVLVAFAQPCVGEFAKISNILEQLSEAMHSNGLIVLDILNGPCCWNMVKRIINKYVPLTPAVQDCLKVISNQKSDHVRPGIIEEERIIRSFGSSGETCVYQDFTSSMSYIIGGFLPCTIVCNDQRDSEISSDTDFEG